MIPGRRLRDGWPEHLARMHQRAVQEAPGNQNVPQHLALAVQRKQVKLLHLEIPQPATEQTKHILGFPDPRDHRTLLTGVPRPQLEGRKQAPRLGGPDARRPKQLRTGPIE